MEKRFIYATNRSQVIYRFLISDENESEYIVYDDSTSSYELSQVIFYINKEDLCKARCEDKTWAFIVTEDFFASFNLEDVKKEYDNRRKEIIIETLKREKEILKELKPKIKKVEEYNKNVILDDFNLGDSLFILKNNKLYKATVTSFYTTNKIDFIPCIKSDVMYDDTTILQKVNNDLFIEINEYIDDLYGYERQQYKVFVSERDYEIYCDFVNNEKIKSDIARIKRYINRLEEDLLKL